MSHTILVEVQRVEHWRPPYGHGDATCTLLEVENKMLRYDYERQHVNPALSIDNRDNGGYPPPRIVVSFPGRVDDYAPGDVLALTMTRCEPVAPETDDDATDAEPPF